jgi:hypothetical protein
LPDSADHAIMAAIAAASQSKATAPMAKEYAPVAFATAAAKLKLSR